ncbi:uncharacterized protein LOC113508100 [Trichoplusia ni]|uniref:Uncharacterized protein LOC113508100 n=1 Tax=Trichoplusia ni TaxID=7111 RepID=A0A7E5X3B7_TRINI|nr:uncharacterized protein LOC113508100 [Trichoplusia ni]
MWLKILCIVVIASGAVAQDKLLNTLYGVEGRNRMSVCVRAPSGRVWSCDAALLNREWLLTRALCLGAAPRDNMAAVREADAAGCQEFMSTGKTVYNSRMIREKVMHPWFNLAILIVDRPYNNLSKLSNITQIRLQLEEHGVLSWMKNYFKVYALTRDTDYHLNLVARNMKTNHYPVWMFLLTIFLPSVSFILVFIYVIFYTGSPAVPYKNLSPKKVTQV